MARVTGEHEVEVEAGVDACFAVAADLEAAPAWHGTMQDVEVLARDPEGRASRLRTTADAGIAQLKLELAFSYDAPGEVRWKRTGGDLSDLAGSWSFAPIGTGRTRVRHALEVDPGGRLGLLVRGPVLDKLRGRLVVEPAEGLKRAVEAAPPSA